VIDPTTGTLLLPGLRLGAGLTLAEVLASNPGRSGSVERTAAGWAHVDLGPQLLGQHTFGVRASFDGERLDGYTLAAADPRFGSSWDDWSSKKELARRDAHDAWLMEALGVGGGKGPGLAYALPWGEAWSRYDAAGGSASIGIRFRRP
jgi:hypothetical protein